MAERKNIVIFANIIHRGKNIFLKRPIAGKTYIFLKEKAEGRDIPIQGLFSVVLIRAHRENKKGYLPLSFVKDTLEKCEWTIIRTVKNQIVPLVIEI